jgi:hypothetical protein
MMGKHSNALPRVTEETPMGSILLVSVVPASYLSSDTDNPVIVAFERFLFVPRLKTNSFA